MPTLTPWQRTHLIALGPSGRLADGGRLATDTGDLAQTMAALGSEGAERVVLYIHSGMVLDAEALAIDAGIRTQCESLPAAFPLFVHWRSGPVALLPQRLRLLMQHPLIVHLGTWVSRAVAPDAELAPRAPGAVARLESAMRDDRALIGCLDDLRRAREDGTNPAGTGPDDGSLTLFDSGFLNRVLPPEPSDLDPHHQAIGFRALARDLLRVAIRVQDRQGSPSWHGPVSTTVEELIRRVGDAEWVGPAAWERAKAVAASAYDDGHGGAQLADALGDWLADEGHELHVVAHGAGAWHAAHLLAALASRRPSGTLFTSLALLAPACDQAFTESVLAPHAQRVGHLRLFVLDASRQGDSWFVPDVYPGSFLQFASGLLEDHPDWPLLGRHGPQSQAACQALGADVVVGPTDPEATPPSACGAGRDGDFPRDPDTLHSIATLIHRGAVAQAVATQLRADAADAPETSPDAAAAEPPLPSWVTGSTTEATMWTPSPAESVVTAPAETTFPPQTDVASLPPLAAEPHIDPPTEPRAEPPVDQPAEPHIDPTPPSAPSTVPTLPEAPSPAAPDEDAPSWARPSDAANAPTLPAAALAAARPRRRRSSAAVIVVGAALIATLAVGGAATLDEGFRTDVIRWWESAVAQLQPSAAAEQTNEAPEP